MLATLIKRLDRLEAKKGHRAPTNNHLLTELRRDPIRIMTRAGLTPDPWQRNLLCSISRRTLLLCSRQAGKSTTAAALALRTALLTPPALVLLLSPTERQSGELFRRTLDIYRDLGRPVATVAESALRLELANGSRIVALPGTERTIRCYSGVKLLVVDEAARVPDDLYRTIRPMLAVSGGQLVALTTPFGKLGWFYEAWTGRAAWQRIKITAEQCPRISAEFLAEERLALGDRWYRQEYLCDFSDTIDAVFSSSDIDAALTGEITPLFGTAR